MEELARTPPFEALRDRILALADPAPSERLLDVGAGTGLLALAVAPRVTHVTALDVSPGMCARLRRRAEGLGAGNVEVVEGTATRLPLGDRTVDLVVSNYCFHHLRDRDKLAALAEVMRVLEPGGRFVFGDMMFGVSLVRSRDRAVVAGTALRMLRRGPAGVLRLLRNAVRLAAGRGEHPARPEWWRDALRGAGFEEVSVTELRHEGGIAFARRPA
jgi:ubiquinone/menaquinone biosynthesis C-methylase UbiE